MKRGTDLLLKFKKLKSSLNLSHWEAKGVLQALWDFTAENAIEGNIGRFSNEDIALGIEWEGDADALIDALILTKWIDRNSTHRLMIHDWEDHCEEYIRKRLTRKRRTTADNGSLPDPDPDPLPDPVPDPEPPISSPARTAGKSADDHLAHFAEFWEQYPKRRDKGDALKAWKKLKPSAGLRAHILKALDAQKASKEWTKDGGQFIPYPAKWLRRMGWENAIEADALPAPGQNAGEDTCLF